MDMYYEANGVSLPGKNFKMSTAGSCGACDSTTSTMCRYAAFNGYCGNGTNPTVSWSFPTSVSGVSPPSGAGVIFPFLKVVVKEKARPYFAPLVGANKYTTVGASATCATAAINGAPPLVVLNPTATNSLSISGSSTLQIVGGSPRNVEVNSSATSAIYGGNIDLSKGGPSYTGGDLGVLGGPSSAPSGFMPGSTGHWLSPAAPTSDPFRSVPTPNSVLGISSGNQYNPAIKQVGYHDQNCPEQIGCNCPDPNGCSLYYPGKYTHPICTKNATSIFKEGVYVIAPTDWKKCADGSNMPGSGSGAAFYVDANGEVRNATRSSQQQGVMFYVTGAVNFEANSASGRWM